MSKFKIGDRVRENLSKGGTNLVNHWQEFWERGQGPLENNTFVIVDVDSYGSITYSNHLGGDGPIVTADYLELVEASPMPTPEYSCIRVVPPSKPKREIIESEVFFDQGASFKIEDGGDNDVNIGVVGNFFTAKALREAAALFTTLAEVLEENAK